MCIICACERSERAPQKHIFSGLKILVAYAYNAVPDNGAIKRQYTDKTPTLRKCMYMYMRASELRKCSHFHSKTITFSIFCWYFRYFVGLHVPTNFQMYQQNSEKALLGSPPPPRPSGLAKWRKSS